MFLLDTSTRTRNIETSDPRGVEKKRKEKKRPYIPPRFLLGSNVQYTDVEYI